MIFRGSPLHSWPLEQCTCSQMSCSTQSVHSTQPMGQQEIQARATHSICNIRPHLPSLLLCALASNPRLGAAATAAALSGALRSRTHTLLLYDAAAAEAAAAPRASGPNGTRGEGGGGERREGTGAERGRRERRGWGAEAQRGDTSRRKGAGRPHPEAFRRTSPARIEKLPDR